MKGSLSVSIMRTLSITTKNWDIYDVCVCIYVYINIPHPSKFFSVRKWGVALIGPKEEEDFNLFFFFCFNVFAPCVMIGLRICGDIKKRGPLYGK